MKPDYKDQWHVQVKYKDKWEHLTGTLSSEELKVFNEKNELHIHEGECHCMMRLGRKYIPRDQVESIEIEPLAARMRYLDMMTSERMARYTGGDG